MRGTDGGQQTARPKRDTCPVAGRVRPRRPSRCGVAGGGDFGSRPARRRARSHTRRAAGSPGARTASAQRGVHHEIVARRYGSAGTSNAHARDGSRREAVTPLGPARLENGSTRARRHPMAKAVTLRPTAGVRLIRALHSCLLDPGRCRRPARDAGRLTRRAPRPAPGTEQSFGASARRDGPPGYRAGGPSGKVTSLGRRNTGTGRQRMVLASLILDHGFVRGLGPGLVHSLWTDCGRRPGTKGWRG
jgi:hypothetical protein